MTNNELREYCKSLEDTIDFVSQLLVDICDANDVDAGAFDEDLIENHMKLHNLKHSWQVYSRHITKEEFKSWLLGDLEVRNGTTAD